MAVLLIGPDLRRAGIPELCARLTGLLGDCPDGETVSCDVSTAPADIVTVEALARLRLTARRHGRRLSIHHAGPALRELIIMLGLDGPLTADPPP
ncbi:STAS domain-containing protein [Actinoplanes sp. G11-F43]|uniref:STAS domain-containing protein n=1 Tax=Actinoplanes sp. G11-F43 TaxID=3424130 RepID=UPI003D35773E